MNDHEISYPSWQKLPFLVSASTFMEFTGLSKGDFYAFVAEGRIHRRAMPGHRAARPGQPKLRNHKYLKTDMLQFMQNGESERKES